MMKVISTMSKVESFPSAEIDVVGCGEDGDSRIGDRRVGKGLCDVDARQTKLSKGKLTPILRLRERRVVRRRHDIIDSNALVSRVSRGQNGGSSFVRRERRSSSGTE